MRSLKNAFFLALVATTLHAQWTAVGDMPQPTQSGNALRFQNAQAIAVVTALAPEVIRVRVTQGKTEPRDHSYAVVNRDLGDAGATFASTATQSTITTSALTVTIQHAPFRISFATRDGQPLDADDPQRGIVMQGSAIRISKRLRDDDHIYGLGEKTGPLDKRGWKLGGYSYTMWNSDTFGYDQSTDPIYVSVPFYIDLRKGVAFGIFFDNTYRSNFDIGHKTPGILSFGAEGGPLDYYFIYGPQPKQIIERYTKLTGHMPLPPLWALGYNQCRYSYYPESRVRFIADNFRQRKIPADTIWLDIHYMDKFKPFTWDPQRFPNPAKMISDLRAEGFRVVTIVDPHPIKEVGYYPYDSGIAGNHFVKNPDGTVYEGPVWPSRPDEITDWSKPSGTPSVFPDFSQPSARAWWGSLYATFTNIGVAGIWNDMNEPAVFDTPTGTMPLDVRHDNEGSPTDHREIHNVYGMLMSRSTYEGLLKLRPNERPFVLTRASFAGGQRYSAMWPGDNTSNWSHLRGSIPMLLGMGLSGLPFVGSDIGGFAGVPTPELFTRWIQLGVFYPFMRTHTVFGSPDQEPWSYGVKHEVWNRQAIELRYELLPEIYNVMHDTSETGLPAMRPLMLDYPTDEGTYANDDEFLFGSDLLVAPVVEEGATSRGVYLPAGQWYDYWTGKSYTGGKSYDLPVTMASIPIFVRGGAIVFTQPVVQSTNEMPAATLNVTLYPAATATERTLYEDEGNGFGYQKGVFERRKFSAHRDGTAMVVDIAAPEGSYRPRARTLAVSIVSQTATRVTVNGSEVAPSDWSVKDGSVTVKLPDRFEATTIRVE